MREIRKLPPLSRARFRGLHYKIAQDMAEVWLGLSHRIHVQTLVFGRAKRKRGNVSEGGVLCFVGLKEKENRECE